MSGRTLSRRGAAVACVALAVGSCLPSSVRADVFTPTGAVNDYDSLLNALCQVQTHTFTAGETWRISIASGSTIILPDTLSISTSAAGEILGNGAVFKGTSDPASYDAIILASDNLSIDRISVSGFQNGVTLQGSHDTISSSNITGNLGYGVFVSGIGASVQNNQIGENSDSGVQVQSTSHISITGNTIFDNSNPGITVVDSLLTQISHNCVIAVSDDASLAGNRNGIIVSNSRMTDISSNNLTANNAEGIYLRNGTTGSSVSGNTITENFGAGIHIDTQSAGNSILENNILTNGGAGVLLTDAGLANPVLSNNISGNGELGIDVGEDAQVTANSTGTDHQNFPNIITATVINDQVVITGCLQSDNQGKFLIQFFANDAKDPSGYGQGQIYLIGGDILTTGGNFTATFNSHLLQVGQFLTATATSNNGAGSTSEFSLAVPVGPGTATGGGTDPTSGGTVVPLPSSAWAGLFLLGLIGASRLLPRRRKA